MKSDYRTLLRFTNVLSYQGFATLRKAGSENGREGGGEEMEERRGKDRVDATLFTCTGIPIQGNREMVLPKIR